MPAYVIGIIDVTDPELYDEYKARAAAAVARYGGRYIVRGGQVDVLEGAAPAGRVAVGEFPDMAAARRFYDSEDYQEAAAIRQRAATTSLFVVDGA